MLSLLLHVILHYIATYGVGADSRAWSKVNFSEQSVGQQERTKSNWVILITKLDVNWPRPALNIKYATASAVLIVFFILNWIE